MNIAQTLYEGIDLGNDGPEGLITYMRTDSVRIVPEALEEARAFILKTYGKDFAVEECEDGQCIGKEAELLVHLGEGPLTGNVEVERLEFGDEGGPAREFATKNRVSPLKCEK